MKITGRDVHLIHRALSIALDIMSRAHPRHVPQSDADEMADLYLRLVPDEDTRVIWGHQVWWLLNGGLDLRERPYGPMPIASTPLSPEPAPGGGEKLAA